MFFTIFHIFTLGPSYSIEEIMRNQQEFRMRWLAFLLGSIVCISNMPKKKKKKTPPGKKMVENYYQWALQAQFSIAHIFCSPLTLGKLSSLFAFIRQSARPLVVCCFLLSVLCFLFLHGSACPLCFMLKGDLKMKVREKIIGCIYGL